MYKQPYILYKYYYCRITFLHTLLRQYLLLVNVMYYCHDACVKQTDREQA